MSRRAWRVMLVVGLAGVIALAGAQMWRLDRDRGRALNEAQAFDAVAQRLLRAVLDARASERAYVATGQGFPYWKPRVDQELQQIHDDLATLKAQASPDVAARIDTALEAFGDVTRLEQRISEHAGAGRLPHASDLIFADGLQASIALEHAADTIVEAHRSTWLAARSEARWQELGLTAAIAAAGLLVALLLAPLRKASGREAAARAGADTGADAAARDAVAEAGNDAATGLGLSLRPTSPSASSGKPAAAGAAGVAQGDSRRGNSLQSGAASAGSSARDEDQTRPGTSAAGSGAAARSGGGNAAASRNDLRLASSNRGAASAAGTGASDDTSTSITATTAAAADATAETTAKTGRWSAPWSAAPSTPSSSALSSSPAASATPPSGAGAPPAAATSTSTLAVAAATDANANSASALSALEDAAALVSAFAQASNAHELDELLPRMARQLDAIGLIVWLKDDEGHALKAALSHGYPEYTLTALAAIDPDSQNATARAARLAQPQIVPSSGSTPGALVVPMLTATGCAGVVSIELPAGREQDAKTSALARIFAAQLAMLTA